jgi:hypothetical protein
MELETSLSYSKAPNKLWGKGLKFGDILVPNTEDKPHKTAMNLQKNI